MTGTPTIRLVIPGLWLAWLLYWWLSARDVKANRWQEPPLAQATHRLPLILAVVVYAAPGWFRVLSGRFLPPSPVLPVLGTALLAAGLGFTVWARRHLGRNWSARVVVKEDHVLVRTGPYRRLRHPIYTGISIGFLGMALAVGEWRSLVALGLVLVAFVLKSRAEEQRMRETFPEYTAYQRETSALIPFIY